jgi:ferredoxin
VTAPGSVTVDHDLCVGATLCVQLAPAAFRLDEEGRSLFAPEGAWDEADVQDAIDGCPMAAIHRGGIGQVP